jgi:hypothetical protein
LNRAELRGLRAAAEALNPNVGERFAIVEGDRVRAFDLSEERAEDWRETFFPMADVVSMAELFLPEPDKDESDMVCPECGDPDCSRPFGHPTEDDERSIAEDIAYHEAKDEGRIRRHK